MSQADRFVLLRGSVVLPDRIVPDGAVLIDGDRLAAVGKASEVLPPEGQTCRIIDAGDGYLVPGFIDLHVHGGDGADFMDGASEAFERVLVAHARHGTTSLLPTTTVASHEQIVEVLKLCRAFKQRTPAERRGARVLGSHFYGPYFNYEARGCHPGNVRPPQQREFEQYLEFAPSMVTATVAAELPGAEAFVRACSQRGVRTNMGHSQCTFEQAAAAVRWGVRHVDHLYCAMSDKTKRRQMKPFPMEGGLLEATLYFDELTTEVIADGKHLSADLLLLAWKIKGPDRLALVTDANRALDMPEGRYIFGPLEGGEPFLHQDGVGLMPDGQGLASATQGLDHMVRTFAALTGRPLWEVIRLASLTPARIAGMDHDLGSLAAGKRADVLVLDNDLRVQRVLIDGREAFASSGATPV
jgi:N-acetylglucosamine-6-phosphate deacetylase